MNRREARFKVQIGCSGSAVRGTRIYLTESEVTAILKANCAAGNPCKVWQYRTHPKGSPSPAGGVFCDKQGNWHWQLEIRLRKEKGIDQ